MAKHKTHKLPSSEDRMLGFYESAKAVRRKGSQRHRAVPAQATGGTAEAKAARTPGAGDGRSRGGAGPTVTNISPIYDAIFILFGSINNFLKHSKALCLYSIWFTNI